MFELTEDKKSIRPMLIGKIKNNILRRVLMVCIAPFTLLIVIILNVSVFVVHTFVLLWRLVILGNIKAILGTFKKWECWDNPRI